MKTVKKTITLTANEREILEAISRSKNKKANEVLHSKILLLSDDSSGAMLAPTAVARKLSTTKQTVATIKKRYFDDGIDNAIGRKKRETPPVPSKITGEIEAQIISLACQKSPDGRNRWTLRLIADEMVELKHIDSISYKTVQNVLKKRNLSLT